MKIKCTVCKEDSYFYSQHPEAEIYKCYSCGHVFSACIKKRSIYNDDYFKETHRNWFNNPDTKIYQKIYEFIKDRNSRSATLIDLGCGNGQFLEYIRGKDQYIELYGVDLSHNRERKNIKFFQTDIEHFKVREKFDFITLLAFIEHVHNLDELAKTLRKISKKNTLLIILTINENSVLYRTSLFLKNIKKVNMHEPFNRIYSAHHVQHFTINSLREYMRRAGYEHVKTRHHNIHMKAIDIDASTPLLRFLFNYGVYASFLLGKVLNRTYLQTAFFRKV